ncbi:MAG: ParA family protein [Nitrospinae bacterium]|nr:ParA family protein [Nitrospinota bacterium]
MPIVSIIGPKGGIGKTTISLNTAAALTQSLKTSASDRRVCLIDLDLRLPTISSLLDSHPNKTFYDLFETLANRTYQVDFLRTIYHISTWFKGYLEGSVPARDEKLVRCLAWYKNLNADLFRFADFRFGDQVHELFLHRGKIHSPEDLKILVPVLDALDLRKFKEELKSREDNAWPVAEEFIKYIEEYGFSILGGEIPILGKKNHRKRINEPEFLLLFLEVLNGVFRKFDYVILDTPAGGVNHLSSLMNCIDHVLFVFDLSNNIAVNGSVDAIHSFIDYYEDLYDDFVSGKLTGLDKAYVNRLVAEKGERAVRESLENKKFSLVFNRCQEEREITGGLNQLREYLDTLDKLEKYKDRIHIAGLVPHHKVINIANNRGALFYNKDGSLTERMDQVAANIVDNNARCPSLAAGNRAVLDYLRKQGWMGFAKKLHRVASSLT